MSGAGTDLSRRAERAGVAVELVREQIELLELEVRGECMAPRLLPGSRVGLERRRLPLPGDVVAFAAADGELQVHRLLGYRPWRGRWCVVTARDGAGGHDVPVALSRVLGRVRWSEDRTGERRPFRVSAGERRRAVAAFLRLATRGLGRRLGGFVRGSGR